MPNKALIGIGAGLVSAIVLASAASGPLPMRFLLFFLTALPLFLAGLGWGWVASALGVASGIVLLAIGTSLKAALLFALTQGLPVTILCYLATLHRDFPATAGGAVQREWYPVGRLVVWAAAISGLLSILSLLALGGDIDELRKGLRAVVEAAAKDMPQLAGGKTLDDQDIGHLTEISLALLPAAMSLSWMSALLANMWLAGRITLASERLVRAWPDLAAMAFPHGTQLVLAAATAATFLDGFMGLAAAAVAGAFFLAYMLLGLAIVHHVTRGQAWRPFALWAMYGALVAVFTLTSLVLALIGLGEPFLPFKRSGAPPGPNSRT